MKKEKRPILCLSITIIMACAFIFSVFCTHAGAQITNVGTSTANFLKIGLGGRSAGMGGAVVASGEGVESLFCNPAGLSLAKMVELGASFNNWFEGISNTYLAFGYPFKNGKTVLGLTAAYWNMGEIEVTSTSSTVERYATVTEGFGGVSISHALMPGLLAGISVKYIFQDLVACSVNGVSADVGLVILLGDMVRIGVAGQNLGTVQAVGGTQDALPTVVKSGGSLTLWKTATIEVDAVIPRDNDVKLQAGLEYLIKSSEYNSAIALRAGYNQAEATSATAAPSDLSGISIGIGIRGCVGEGSSENMLIDYAYVPFGGFGVTHRFSMVMRF